MEGQGGWGEGGGRGGGRGERQRGVGTEGWRHSEEQQQ